NDDEWVASIASYVRNSFGNHASMINEAQVAKARKASEGRTLPWTLTELQSTLPQPVGDKKDWKLTSSHNQGKVRNAIDDNPGSRFDTGTPQVPGMWFQIELPHAV